VNQVEAREAPAIIRTRMSFSMPRIESANLGRDRDRVSEPGAHRETIKGLFETTTKPNTNSYNLAFWYASEMV
jgi:hypothetical protein